MTVVSPLFTQYAHSDYSPGQIPTPPSIAPLNITALVPPQSLRCDIIRPTLTYLGVTSNAAENLLLGTLLAMAWLPRDKHWADAIGPYAITPAVHTRLWDEYLALQPDQASLIRWRTPRPSPGCCISNKGCAWTTARMLIRSPVSGSWPIRIAVPVPATS